MGVASNKFLAKLATNHASPGQPIGSGRGVGSMRVVEPGRELQFLHPLPVGNLWGVGPPRWPSSSDSASRRSATSRGRRIRPREQPGQGGGSATCRTWPTAVTIAVVPDQEPKSISHEETFATDPDLARAVAAPGVDAG